MAYVKQINQHVHTLFDESDEPLCDIYIYPKQVSRVQALAHILHLDSVKSDLDEYEPKPKILDEQTYRAAYDPEAEFDIESLSLDAIFASADETGLISESGVETLNDVKRGEEMGDFLKNYIDSSSFMSLAGGPDIQNAISAPHLNENEILKNFGIHTIADRHLQTLGYQALTTSRWLSSHMVAMGMTSDELDDFEQGYIGFNLQGGALVLPGPSNSRPDGLRRFGNAMWNGVYSKDMDALADMGRKLNEKGVELEQAHQYKNLLGDNNQKTARERLLDLQDTIEANSTYVRDILNDEGDLEERSAEEQTAKNIETVYKRIITYPWFERNGIDGISSIVGQRGVVNVLWAIVRI